jgi:hypothetical protein
MAGHAQGLPFQPVASHRERAENRKSLREVVPPDCIQQTGGGT